MTAVAASLASVWRFRELIAMLAERDLKVRYKRSILGMGWTLLNPLLQMLVYTVVFSIIMRVGVPQFPVFLLSGLLPWTLISVSITGSAQCLLNNQALIRKVAVPQMVYPLAVVFSKLIDVVLSLVPFVVIAVAMGRPPGLASLFVVPALVLAALFATGLALLFSSLTVFYRDMRHLTDILLQVWFYLTPVFYPTEFLAKLPSRWMEYVLLANPATPIVRVFQSALYERRVPSPGLVAAATACAVAVFVAGLAVFLRHEDEHIHHF